MYTRAHTMYVYMCATSMIYYIVEKKKRKKKKEKKRQKICIDTVMNNFSHNFYAFFRYVIKAVVYEIGILTDTDNATSDESTERYICICSFILFFILFLCRCVSVQREYI